MANRETTFHPSSCACVVVYSWDDERAPAEITFTPVSIQPCDAHAPVLSSQGLQAAFDAVLADNRAAAAREAQQAGQAARE